MDQNLPSFLTLPTRQGAQVEKLQLVQKRRLRPLFRLLTPATVGQEVLQSLFRAGSVPELLVLMLQPPDQLLELLHLHLRTQAALQLHLQHADPWEDERTSQADREGVCPAA